MLNDVDGEMTGLSERDTFLSFSEFFVCEVEPSFGSSIPSLSASCWLYTILRVFQRCGPQGSSSVSSPPSLLLFALAQS